MNWAARTFVFVILLAGLASCSSESPLAVLEASVAEFNAGDVAASVAYMAEDGVYVTGEGVEHRGRAAIQAIQEERYRLSAPRDSSQLIDVEVSGTAISFGYHFVAIDGSCWTITGYRAVIDGGEIVRYESAPQENYVTRQCDP